MTTGTKTITPGRVDGQLRKVGILELDIERLGSEMARELGAIKARYGAELVPLRRKHEKIVAGLLGACQEGRDSLFSEGAKTLKLGFGQVSWRIKPASLRIREGVTEEDVLRRLPPTLQLHIRTKQSLDKQSLKRDIEQGGVSATRLKALGLELVQGEEAWSVKPDHEAVRQVVGQP